jgi:hypothetical protein
LKLAAKFLRLVFTDYTKNQVEKKMKKISLAIFILALAIGLVFSTNCSFSVNKFSSVQGSGNAKTETRNVSGFTRVDASGAVNVEVTAQSDFNVTVEADDNLLQNIKTEVSGDTLKIYNEEGISTKSKINVKISMPEIQGLELSGASNGNVTNVKADSFDLKASGASKVKIDGVAKELNAEASGASKLDAENFRVENANIEATGASSAVVSATGDLELEASGASRISYTGEPKNVKQNSSGASSIGKK